MLRSIISINFSLFTSPSWLWRKCCLASGYCLFCQSVYARCWWSLKVIQWISKVCDCAMDKIFPQLKENVQKISYSLFAPHLGCPAVEFSLLDHLRQVDRYKGLSTLSPGISWYSLNNWGFGQVAHMLIWIRGSTHFESLWNLASSGPASACVSVSTYNLARSTLWKKSNIEVQVQSVYPACSLLVWK